MTLHELCEREGAQYPRTFADLGRVAHWVRRHGWEADCDLAAAPVWAEAVAEYRARMGLTEAGVAELRENGRTT